MELCARIGQGELTIALFSDRMVEGLFPDRQLSFSPRQLSEEALAAEQANALGVESEDRRGLCNDGEGYCPSLQDLIATSEHQEKSRAGIMGMLAAVTKSPLHGLETIGRGLDTFLSCNFDADQEECLEEHMARTSEELAHPGFLHSVCEDLQDNLIAAEDWLEATQALGT